MSLIQILCFFTILVLVTARTLILRCFSKSVTPDTTAFVVGLGTTLVCLTLLPVAIQKGLVSSSSWSTDGIIAGMMKGVFLTFLLVAQQKLIGRSMSATTYVFPIALGVVAVVEAMVFDATLSLGGILAIGLLFFAGIGFSIFGHLGSMPKVDKGRFFLMIVLVVAFSVCDKIGISNSGWYLYLLFTGLGNLVSSLIISPSLPKIDIWPWLAVAIIWVIPELFFNYAIEDTLSVSYGYLAITLRVPILMIFSVVFFKEGKISSQLAFGILALIGTIPLFY